MGEWLTEVGWCYTFKAYTGRRSLTVIIWAASAVLEGMGVNGEESENLKGGRKRGRCKGAAGSAATRPELS